MSRKNRFGSNYYDDEYDNFEQFNNGSTFHESYNDNHKSNKKKKNIQKKRRERERQRREGY